MQAKIQVVAITTPGTKTSATKATLFFREYCAEGKCGSGSETERKSESERKGHWVGEKDVFACIGGVEGWGVIGLCGQSPRQVNPVLLLC